MLVTRSGQVGFFDAAELARPLPAGSFFALLAEHGDRIVRDEDFAACYSPGVGRPSIPPSLLARVLLLQYRTGASDEQAMESVAWDLRWKVAAGLALDDEGFHPTVLTLWRNKLRASERPERIFDAVREVIDATGVLKGKVRRALDSTVLDDAVATQDTVTQLISAIRRVRRLIPAATALELVGHDFSLFVDARTDHPSVVYRRKGWDYGVISLTTQAAPEAVAS